MKEINVNEILKLNTEGKTVKEIREILSYSMTTIRKVLTEHNRYNNFTNPNPILINTISSKIDEGLTAREIANLLNISKTTVVKYNNLYIHKDISTKRKRVYKEDIELTNEQLEFLYGSLLGDMSISKGVVNARCAISQGGEQEDYFDYKCSIIKDYLGKISKTPRYDKRADKWYNKYLVRTLANPVFNELYNQLYVNGVKTITREWLNKLAYRSLAFWFMDDGHQSGVLATNCFSEQECKLIQEVLLNKFNIQTTIQHYNNSYLIYITKKGKIEFYKNCVQYFIPSMLYKVHNWNLVK